MEVSAIAGAGLFFDDLSLSLDIFQSMLPNGYSILLLGLFSGKMANHLSEFQIIVLSDSADLVWGLVKRKD